MCCSFRPFQISMTVFQAKFEFKLIYLTTMHIFEQVAVKVLEKSKIKDKKDVERISREIKILKQLHHPNVVQIYEIIETDKDLYLVMEFASGGELFELIV